MAECSWEYDVALSFAGEQREYVEAVAHELERYNVKCFYDYNEQINLWGKNLTKYLDEIYFSKSKYFIPFLSLEYRDKVWTKWELSSALDRYLDESYEYILPVRFDNTRIPGIVGSLAFLDATRLSPEKLAKKIHEKLHDGKSLDVFSPSQFEQDFTSVTPYINLHKEIAEQVMTEFTNNVISHSIVIFGERGIGKKTAIRSFLSRHKGVIHVKALNDSRYQYESLVKALSNSEGLFFSIDDLNFPERLRRQYISICQSEQTTIYFEQMDQYQDGLVTYIMDLANHILLRHPEYRTFFIFEYDNDTKSSADLESRFYTLPPKMMDFYHVDRLTNDNLYEYLGQTFGEIEGSQEDIDRILSASSGNIMYLNVIVNFLRAKGVLIRERDHFMCKHIVDGMLTDVLKKYIIERYDRLDTDLKEVLNRSTVIGNTFSSELLSKPFGIIDADVLLGKIEEISRLIYREDCDTFTFENVDSFRLISSSIPPIERRQWHHVLAEYFLRRLNNDRYDHPSLSIENEIKDLFPVAHHFQYAEQYSNSIFYYYELIERYLAISDYDSAIKIIKNIRLLKDEISTNTFPISNLAYHLLKYEATCLCGIGNFKQALLIYQNAIELSPNGPLSQERLSLQLEAAYSYYMAGQTTKSLEIALNVQNCLEAAGDTGLLHCKVLSFLASIYDGINRVKEKQNYYIQTLNFCKEHRFENEYYLMLRKASMVYSEDISIKMYPATIEYFESHHMIKNLAETLHNYATDLMYLCMEDQMLLPLARSQELFQSFGCAMIHYPLNTQGIYEAVFLGKIEKSIETFSLALQHETECYSVVTIRTNMMSCYLYLGHFDKALNEIVEIERLISLPINSDIREYEVFRYLNRAFYYYHEGDYSQCQEVLKRFQKYDFEDPRFKYIGRYLAFLSKQKMGIRAKRLPEKPPKPVLAKYLEKEVYFLTVRFFE